ncbi:hypothetical protein [Aestuariimicrobium sp. Y1814]|uniref:hypothetical protein n=1 Tax=Aestuariimicrobium sp. Y1814 TaxID=3418742 RepID=UPI003DA70315
MSTITLTLTATTVTLVDGRATLTASVTNEAPVTAKVVLGAFGLPGTPPATGAAGWATIDRPSRDIAAGATDQFTVTFEPVTEPAAGSHPVRFIAYSADQAPEENADQARQVDVIVPAAPVPVVAKRTPWWPIAAAVALLLVVGVAAWWLLRPDAGPATPPVTPPVTPSLSPSPSEPPSTPAPPCKEPLVPRLTRPTDLVCVTKVSAAQVIIDNDPDTQAQRRAGGGPYGPDTCKVGWVWRDAFPGDHVCVTGETRARTAAENKAATQKIATLVGTKGPVVTKIGTQIATKVET